MKTHTVVHQMLYEFLFDELSREDRAFVETHLAQCADCRGELEGLRRTVHAFPPDTSDPSASLPPAFWTELLNVVESRIAQRKPEQGWLPRGADWLVNALTPHRRLVLGVASITIVVTSAFVTWSVLRQNPSPPPVAESAATAPSESAGETRMDNYLRKSRLLFVGVTNMPVAEGQPVDLSTERSTSRQLVEEARILKQQALDDRSVRLINDLERIQIELANMEGRDETPTIKLVKSGIERQNLLFKIRIEESIQLQVRHVENR